MIFICFPLSFVGGVCLYIGYMKEVANYVASQSAHVMFIDPNSYFLFLIIVICFMDNNVHQLCYRVPIGRYLPPNDGFISNQTIILKPE